MTSTDEKISGSFEHLNAFKGNAKIMVVTLTLFFTLSLKMVKGNEDIQLRDTCNDPHDTTLFLNFSLEKAETDFYDLLSLIERKGEFSRFTSENNVDSSTATQIVLKKILCWEKIFESPVELWQLNNIFSISYYLVSTKHTKEKEEPQPGFRITQLNFVDNREMQVAANKISEIRWGEPLLACNFWFLVKGDRRIYILQNYLPGFTEGTQKYMAIIQKEWVNKNIR